MSDFYKNKTILLTGHTGFKGTWLSIMLEMAGARVVGYALKPPAGENLFQLSGAGKGMTDLEGDIRDYQNLKSVFDKYQPELVIHMAAQPIVRESYENPVYTYETNVMGTVHLLECVRNTESVSSVLNVTTDKVYENREWIWGYRETDPLDGYDPYSNSKSCSELVTHSYKKSFFDSRKCHWRRRLCKRQDYTRLCPGRAGKRRNYAAESIFHKTLPACAGAVDRLPGNRGTAGKGAGEAGLL